MQQPRPRTSRRFGALLASGLALALVASACSSDDDEDTEASGGEQSDAPASPDDTLELALLNDMGAPDPDTYYAGEGLNLMLSVYERLVDYVPDSNELVGLLAESWEISDDGLVYTFDLRPDVVFHDGTPADAEAWVASFERRRDIESGMSYFVADVAETAAPDPDTFVVTLSRPNNAFLDYLASPWGPYAVSPTAVEENEEGGDLAQGFFETNDAGTGPYTITDFEPGVGYTIEYFEDWWGPEPDFKTINFSIVPESSNQRLQLENGDIDLIHRGLTPEEAAAFEDQEGFNVSLRPDPPGIGLWMNTLTGPMADVEVRQAMISAIDRDEVVNQAFGGSVPVLTGFYSPATVPEDFAPFEYEFDPSELEALVPSMEDTSLVLGYPETRGAPFRRMSEYIGARLGELGLDVTVQPIVPAEEYEIATADPASRPDLMLQEWGGGDGLHPDMSLRIFLYTDALPLNWFNYSNPAVDAAMDAAIAEPTREEALPHYEEISELVQEDAIVLPLMPDVARIVYSDRVDNVVSNSHKQNVLKLWELRAT